MHRFLTLMIALILGLSSQNAWGCGADTDCMIGDRHYRIALPEGDDTTAPIGAIVFAHGYRGSAAGIMRNRNLRKLVSDMGLALISIKSASDDWVLPNSPRRTNEDGAIEFNYVEAVLEDAQARFGIDRDRLMMTGFSAGGMMTWNLACHRPDLFAAFLPISGTFWLTPPETCKQPVASIIHIHGDADKTVPLDGRPIADTHQGRVRDSFAMYTDFGAFSAAQPGIQATDRLTCREQTGPGGQLLSLCMFKGGHSFRSEFLSYGWARFVENSDL